MSDFLTHKNISVVTAILPKQTSQACIESVFTLGDQNVLLMHARGTLVRDSWYHSFLPVLSPEKDFLQFLVPDLEVDFIMEQVINKGHLYLPGAGAVYSIPCDEVIHTEDFHLWSELDAHEEKEEHNASLNLRENLSAITCILGEEQTDVVSRAALQTGAHGPIINYCHGRGLRDRLGWLRITKKSQQEVLTIIADNNDADTIIESMVEAGRIDMPGRGFIYRMPVQKGLINIASTYGNRSYGANMKQMISAIDTLMGSGQWRQQNVIVQGGSTKIAGLNLQGKIKPRPSLQNQIGLSCVIARKHVETMLNAASDAGATGAYVSYAKFIEAECKKTSTGIKLNREDGVIRFVHNETLSEQVLESMKVAVIKHDMHNVCFYKRQVGKVITYFTKDRLTAEQNFSSTVTA